MLFNPLKFWLTKGPFNKLFVNYIFNKHIKWYQKVRMFADHTQSQKPTHTCVIAPLMMFDSIHPAQTCCCCGPR
jgi:hypothetical protein